MANFSICEVEGMREIQIDIDNETVRARRGALSNMRGNIQLIQGYRLRATSFAGCLPVRAASGPTTRVLARYFCNHRWAAITS